MSVKHWVKSLRPFFDGSSDTTVFRYLIHVRGRNDYSVRSPKFRMKSDGKLYDPVADPRQERDLALKHPEEMTKMSAFADAYMAEVSDNLTRDTRPFSVGYAPLTWLPARDGNAHGKVKRSAGAPNCSFFTNWKAKEDSITWHVHVMEEATYKIILHYTCAERNVGSLIEVSLGDEKITARITEAFDPPMNEPLHIHAPRPDVESYVKEFRPLSLGRMKLPPGEGTLKLRALEIPGDGVADIRWLEIRRLEK